ncbi:hypothetical protein [Tunicatimonas pelagia]|uniref:hypothetical protein n=1 Tax=Tunicatimonas pelagia TaxID=931531 RepID=UPI00266676FD|nr:hypothetical protein [Tunicatimonas pelagia]WKN40811.1 hypothetical protein P0M28_17380 [Tunicatimonas pelagia]
MTIVKILIIVGGLLLQLPGLAQSNYEALNEDALKSAPLEAAQSLANTLLTSQKLGQPHILSESEAIVALQEEFSAEKQTQTYGAIRDLFGDYQSITFKEAYRTTNAPAYYIFRFQGKFERDNAQPEVRVVMNEKEQLAGFSIVPWQDSL